MHDGDVVRRSDGFGTTATKTPVSCTMSNKLLDESVTHCWLWTIPSVNIPSSDAVSPTTFQLAMFFITTLSSLEISLIITASYFITKGRFQQH